jgi:uncharacterized alpha/beta hydrolase family protein
LKVSRAGLTTYVQRFEAHRAQQKKAAAKQQQKAANKKSDRIRTLFAHGRSGDAGTTAKNRVKSLN